MLGSGCQFSDLTVEISHRPLHVIHRSSDPPVCGQKASNTKRLLIDAERFLS
jgi:hypothetical protein